MFGELPALNRKTVIQSNCIRRQGTMMAVGSRNSRLKVIRWRAHKLVKTKTKKNKKKKAKKKFFLDHINSGEINYQLPGTL